MKRKTEPACPSIIETVFQDQSPAQMQAPSTTGTSALDTVLVHLGYDYKLIKNRNVFLTILEAGCLRSRLSSAGLQTAVFLLHLHTEEGRDRKQSLS